MPKNLAAKKVKVSDKYTRDEKIAIADEIVEYIRDRSAKGRGPGNKKWSGDAGKYSDGYINSLDFKIGEKSKGKVNQRLSGEMLTEMDVLKIDSSGITYGFGFGSEEHGKAKGNILGTYGKSKANPKKARDFLELTHAELKTILSEFPLRGEGSEEKREKSTRSRLDAIASLKGLFDGEE